MSKSSYSTMPKTVIPPAAASGTESVPAKDGVRETIESIVIAFVLAFLFRTFEAEAFVIPTGSMAPTLMGRHYDTNCPECGFPVKIGASEENVEDDSHLSDRQKQMARDDRSRRQIHTHTCPNCRYEADYRLDGREEGELPHSYNGDRIIVSKFPYELGDPLRWDVAVFRYPATPKTNYIKRIVGLPNETVRIQGGDIYTKHQGAADFAIERKPDHKVPVMLQTVYDNDYVLPDMIANGWPARWQPDEPTSPGNWKPSADWRSYAVNGQATDMRWLRYHHFTPSKQEWDALLQGPLSATDQKQIRPLLISDMYAYNSRSPASSGGYDQDVTGLHWVGDLALECRLVVDGKGGEVTLELVEAGRKHHCRIDLTTGQATLSIDTIPQFTAQAPTSVRGPCRVLLRFANVDDRLLLWVNDQPVTFDRVTTFVAPPLENPQENDWAPVGVGVQGVALLVENLRVLRDIYYIADRAERARQYSGPVNDYDSLPPYQKDHTPLFMIDGSIPRRRTQDFELGPDEFFAMGDNSPKSKDSRLWDRKDAQGRDEYYVHRDLLVGKAMFIYWPHAWAPKWAVPIRVRSINMRVPFYPNFSRMQFIR